MGKPDAEGRMREHETPEQRDLLGDGPEIPLGGEGVTDAVADHTPETFRKAKPEQPLLGDGPEIPLGGEAVTDAVADHTPETFRKAKPQQPLLDD
jgi:hypothetical protein